jgi:hypothetical protein
MENMKHNLMNRGTIRVALILVALASFVIAAGAPLCAACP